MYLIEETNLAIVYQFFIRLIFLFIINEYISFNQSFNPVGSLTGILISKFVILDRILSGEYSNSSEIIALGAKKAQEVKAHDLDVINVPYVGVGLFVALIFLIIWRTKISEIELEEQLSIGESIYKIFESKIYLL